MENTRIEALKQAQFAVANAMAALRDADALGVSVAIVLDRCCEAQAYLRTLLSAERAK
jgi:hypothetical protein